MKDFPKRPNYKIIEKLGEGANGIAYKVLNEENNCFYVIKKILLKNAIKEELIEIQKEAEMLAQINSENIVKYFDCFTDNDSFNIIMEYCDGLDLKKYINKHKNLNLYIIEKNIYHIILEICKGLKEVHKLNIIHRDLKPDNIFLMDDLKVKIGDFGISKQLNYINEYAKSQIGTMLYMAPEIINGEKYNNKVDIWSLGCIIQELCTLIPCFDDNSLIRTIINISNCNYKRIDQILYGADLQNLIDLLLNKDYKKRPDIEEVIKYINKNIINLKKKVELLEDDDIEQNYLIEKNIQNSLEQTKLIITASEEVKFKIIYYLGNIILYIFCCFILFFGLFGLIFKVFDLFDRFINEKKNFIKNNSIIVEKIEKKLIGKINDKLDKNILKEKIIIYNKENFSKIIQRIKDTLIKTNYFKNAKKYITKNFNILLIGNTGAGKSTLINEFLKLDDSKKAKISQGVPTETNDFTPYTGEIKNRTYTLYDTNGITNKGKDSIDLKQKNIIKEIIKRLKEHDPNKIIHCIWYCMQGSNVQPSDKEFIKNILNIYDTYSIPIIYIHTQTYLKKQSKTCKMGIEKYLNEIFNNDKSKVEQHLNNYISILALGDEEEEKEAFGLDELEELSQKEIENKGMKYSYFEVFKQDLWPILINEVFSLIFKENNVKKLINISKQNIDNYLKTIIDILNFNKLELTDEVKKNNKNSLNKLCDYFKNNKDKLKNILLDSLNKQKLKYDNEELVKLVYENKDEKYKKEINYIKFCDKVEKLIYSNFDKNKEEIINKLIYTEFNSFIMKIIKNGIKEQFKECEDIILTEIYNKYLKELNEKNNEGIEN